MVSASEEIRCSSRIASSGLYDILFNSIAMTPAACAELVASAATAVR